MGRLTVLKQIAADLASQFGPDCEVVIHDLKTSEPELLSWILHCSRSILPLTAKLC